VAELSAVNNVNQGPPPPPLHAHTPPEKIKCRPVSAVLRVEVETGRDVSRPPTEHTNTFTPRHILVAPPTHVAKHNTELLYTQHLLPRASHGRATSRRPHATLHHQLLSGPFTQTRVFHTGISCGTRFSVAAWLPRRQCGYSERVAQRTFVIGLPHVGAPMAASDVNRLSSTPSCAPVGDLEFIMRLEILTNEKTCDVACP